MNPSRFELLDHRVNARRRHAEEPLEVGLGGCLPVEQDVGVNEGEVLALGLGEAWCFRSAGHCAVD
jgi:hypothetical protein